MTKSNQYIFVALVVLISCPFFNSTAFSFLQPGPKAMNFLKFYYFPTPNRSVEIIFNDTDSLLASNLKAAKKTFILLDGFTSNLTSYMNTETKNVFAAIPDANLILVDWGFYNGNAFMKEVVEIIDIVLAYVTALTSLPFAGENLAYFLDFLRLHKQIEFSDFTILSHSLGCHAAGATGKWVKYLYNDTIGRIVGMDPALQITELETDIRLQIGDASTVEIYHTSRHTLGDKFPATGDVTIYPNGGENQPCEEDSAPGTTGCSSHSYSWKLYNFAATNATIKACPCRGAACLCNDCSFQCDDDHAITIGPYMEARARGSYHVKTGYLQWG